MNPKPTILLVDDTEADVLLFRSAVESIGFSGDIVTFDTVTAASVFLKQEGPYENAPRPQLIVSDSVVDHESGLDLLEWVRVHRRFRDIPFVMLTGNSNPTILQKAEQLGATCVFEKPTDYGDLAETARQILEKGSFERAES